MHAVRGSAWAAAVTLVWLACLAWTTGAGAQQPAQEQTDQSAQQPVQQPAGILVLSVSQEGKHDSRLTRALQEHLDRAGEKTLKTDVSQTDRRCGDPTCLARLAEQVPAALILGERYQATSDHSYNVTAWLYEVATRTPIGRQEHCSSCSPQQLETRVKELADKLLIEQRARAAMTAPQQPEQNQPAQEEPTRPAQTQPAQTQPGQTQPAQTQPGQTQPGPAQTQQTPEQDKQPPDLSGLPEESTEAAPQQEVPNPPSPILPVPVPDDHPRPAVRRPLPVWRKVLGGVLGGLTAASLVGGITWAAMDGGPSGGPCSYMGQTGNYRCVWDTKTNYIAGFVLAGAFGIGMGLVLGLPAGDQGEKP